MWKGQCSAIVLRTMAGLRILYATMPSIVAIVGLTLKLYCSWVFLQVQIVVDYPRIEAEKFLIAILQIILQATPAKVKRELFTRSNVDEPPIFIVSNLPFTKDIHKGRTKLPHVIRRIAPNTIRKTFSERPWHRARKGSRKVGDAGMAGLLAKFASRRRASHEN